MELDWLGRWGGTYGVGLVRKLGRHIWSWIG
jgi:hypothetical protein